MPDLLQLTEDPRYTRLSWEEKQGVLDRFAEDNPTDALPTIKEFERLNHFSQHGTPQTRAYHRDVLTARRKWLQSQRGGGVNKSTADAVFEEDAKVAHAAYRDALDRRQKDLSLAAELLDAEETTSLSFGNVVGDVVDSINPASIFARASGGGSNRDEVFTQAQNRTEEILREFTDLGYTEEDIETIKQDAQLANGAGGNPAAVDSQGQVVINDGALVLNPQSVRDTIFELDASSNVRQAALDSLESRRRQLIDGTFDAIAFEGGLTWDEEPGSFDRTNPRLSPLVGFKTIIPNFFSETARRLGVDGTDAEQRLRGSVEARDASGIFGYRWTDEQKEEAVVNLLNERDDALDRARIGLGQGVLTDTANMILTPLELAGSDTAAGLSEQIREGEEAFSSADRLVNISGTEEFIGLASRVIPQVVLTRGAGRAGGSLAAARGAAPAAQAQLAQRFAVGFGGLQSATFNTRDVLDNGGSPGEALAAGILAFGTTYLLASGFNAAGAGGVEQFRSKAAAGSATAKSQLTQRLVNLGTGAVGEGVEEFVDEYINTLATQSFTGVSAEEAASNAFKGGLIGSVLGGGFGAAQPTRPVTPQSSNEELRQAADQAAAELSADTVRTQEIDTRIAALENREELTPEEDAELQRLLAERERGTPFEGAPEAAEETTPEVDRETPESPFTEADHLEQEVAVDERSVAEPATQPARATQPQQDASPTVPEEAGTRPKMVPGQRATIEGHTGTLVDDGGRLALDLGGGRLLELTDAQLAAATLRPTPFQQNEDGTVTLDGRGGFRYNRSEFDENGDLASVVVSRPSGEEVVLTGDRALSVAFRARLDAAPERARTAPPQPAQETFTAERVFGPATYRGLDSAVSVAERVAEAEAPLGSVDAVPTSEVIAARNQMAARIAEVEQRASRGGYANATETLDKLRVVHDVLSEEVASRKGELRQNLYDRLFAGREDISSQEVEETLEEVMDSGRTDLTEDEENTIVEEYADAAVENGTVEENPTGMISEPDLNTAVKIKLQRELDNTREVNEQLMEEAREGNHYGKTGIPKKYLTEAPTLQTVEEFGDWIADRHEARDNYIEKPNVNPNEESVREEQIQISEELLTAYEEYLEDTAPETDGTTPPTLYGGLFFLDPEFMIPRLKAIASASADFLSFSKQAVLRFGSAIVDGLRSIWNSYQRNGEIEPDTVEQLPQGATVETTEHDAAADASFEEVKAAAGPAGTSPLTTIDGVEAPESVIPLISREDAKTLGGLKQSAVNLLDRVVLLGNKITGLRVPPNLIQNAKDFRPNIAIAANAFSLSTLRSEANLTRTLLEKKFPDLEVTVEDSGNIVVHGALRNDGQPTPKYFSDLAEDIQRNFDKYDFSSDNVREFFKEVVRFNQYTLKMLESEGIVPADLKADGVNQLDLSKLADNIHATRGRVTHRDLLDNPDTNAGHRARLASLPALAGSVDSRPSVKVWKQVTSTPITPLIVWLIRSLLPRYPYTISGYSVTAISDP